MISRQRHTALATTQSCKPELERELAPDPLALRITAAGVRLAVDERYRTTQACAIGSVNGPYRIVCARRIRCFQYSMFSP